MEDFGIQPKSRVALKIVINSARMALDIQIFHSIQLELNMGQAIFLLDLTVSSAGIVTLLPFFYRGVLSSNGIAQYNRMLDTSYFLVGKMWIMSNGILLIVKSNIKSAGNF